MDHEKAISQEGGTKDFVPKGLARSMGDFTLDLFVLTELQLQLFNKDLNAGKSRMLATSIVALAGMVIGSASVPIGLVAFALFLHEQFETSFAISFLLSAISGSVLSVLLITSGWMMFRGWAAILGRSNVEFLRNLRWIKKMLERDRSTRHTSHHSNNRVPI
jgi:small-conductance mechanosensitive channel